MLEKYVNNAEYDLEVSDSESTVALDQVALSNIDGHRFYDADGDEERAEKGKPNTSAFTRVEREERSISGCRSQLERLTRASRWVCGRYATDKICEPRCLNAFYALLQSRRNELQPTTNDFLPKKF